MASAGGVEFAVGVELAVGAAAVDAMTAYEPGPGYAAVGRGITHPMTRLARPRNPSEIASGLLNLSSGWRFTLQK